MRNLLLSILLLTCGLTVSAQHYNFRNYSLKEGLSRSGVYYILQDNAGFLWIGTEGGGVCKFDGSSFIPYTRINGLPSEDIRVIFQDDRNIIWFGTAEGLSYYDGKTFTTITTEDGLSDNYIRSITQDHEGNIWIGTNTGISIIDPNEKGISGKLKFNLSLPHKRVRSLLAVDSTVWIGTDGGLCRYKNQSIEVITNEEGLSNNRVLTLFEDSQGHLWIGTEVGLNKFENGIIKSWNENDGLIDNRIRSLTEDVKGHIWIGTSHGISIFNGESFSNITLENGLSNERIRCVMADDFDNVWIGTFFGGIMRFNYEDFIGFSTDEGLISDQVSSVYESGPHEILVGTYEGVSKIHVNPDNTTASQNINLSSFNTQIGVNVIYRDHQQNFWFGTQFGIAITDTAFQPIMHIESSFIHDHVTAIRYIEGKYWIGTKAGLVLATISKDYQSYEVRYLTAQDGLDGNMVSVIEVDSRGLVWVSFSDGGISILDHEKTINPILPEHLEEVLSLVIDDKDDIWIGTNGNGLFYGKYDLVHKKLVLDNLSVSAGLSSNYIFSLQTCRDMIWAGHEKGIDLLSFEGDSSFVIRHFGPERGFTGLQNNPGSSFIDSDGNLWFGTLNGLFKMSGEELDVIIHGHPSNCYIKKIDVNGISIYWQESEWCSGVEGAFNLPVDLVLPYNKNNISFDFVGLNFISPENIRYSWMLEGFDHDWNPASTKNYASYTNLPPGNYSFRLKASDEYGIIQDQIVSFSFKVDKPFWDTWLFRIVAGFFITLIVMLIMRLRTNKLRKNQKKLEAIIEERTHEIREQNKELEDKQAEIESANHALQEKNEEITDSILYSRRIQRSIMPSREKAAHILGEHFVFYRPKDIVSGDFFWVETVPNNPKHTFFAVADCTGHGVPGAMVSLICTRALNTSLLQNELKNTNEILDQTNEIVISAFTDLDSGEVIKDGMDISLCSLDYSDPTNIKFQFSGAQNPVWIVRKKLKGNLVINEIEMEPALVEGDYALFEIKANKQPIGHFDGTVPFILYSGHLLEGDRIYLFSDGFADQFGGERGKKFKYKSLKELLLRHQHQEIIEQYDSVRDAFYNWKQEFEQIDDVCLMGVEV